MLRKWKKARLSYEEHYEKKYKKGKKNYIILIILLLILTTTVVALGMRKNQNRIVLLEMEAAQYSSETYKND